MQRAYLSLFVLAMLTLDPLIAGVDHVVLQMVERCQPICSNFLGKALQEMSGVVDVQVNAEATQACISWETNKRFRPWLFCERVRRAGYDLEAVSVWASGQICTDGEFLFLDCCDSIMLYFYEEYDLPELGSLTCVSGQIGWCDDGQIYLYVDEFADSYD